MSAVWWRLASELGADEEVGIAAITASELLHGVHRADPEHRVKREAFVEAVIDAFPPVPFDLRSARAHAWIWAELSAARTDVGPHDRFIAATALAHGWRVATSNHRQFRHIQGLDLVELDQT